MQPLLISHDILALGRYLRRLLDNEALHIVASVEAGRPPQLRSGAGPIASIDVDESGDFVVTLRVRRTDLEGSGLVAHRDKARRD